MAAAALSAAERRRPWLLLSPTLATLSLLVIAPMVIMLVYSFYTDLGGGRDKAGFDLANWAEFFSDPYYHHFIWQTAWVSAVTTVLCALMGYPAVPGQAATW
jgi:spermidine/putrescine transport system permease protein